LFWVGELRDVGGGVDFFALRGRGCLGARGKPMEGLVGEVGVGGLKGGTFVNVI